MNKPGSTSIVERSSILRLLRSLLTWRVQRRMLIAAAWLATLIALIYGEENWRGRRAWNSYRQEIESHGGQLELKAFTPKPVPEDQNFAAIPFVKSWFDKTKSDENYKRWKDNYSQAQNSSFKNQSAENPHRGIRAFSDLIGWQKVLAQDGDSASRATAAIGVLEGLKTHEAVLSELRAASSRPFARYPVNYDEENPWAILLPH